MTKLKNLKRNMILCLVYVLLLAVLITGVTTAKYTDAVTVYSSFGAASFNTVILGCDFDENGERIVEALSDSIDSVNNDDFLPGMTYDSNLSENSAKLYPFSISNGVTEDNVSEIGVVFTLRLRAAGNIPLVYSLKHGDTMLFTGAPVSVMATGGADEDARWQEYSFYESASAMTNGEEASFTLGGTTLDYEDFTLVVEWPVTEENGGNSNSTKYMKEVELFELQVYSSSANMSNVYTEPQGYTIPESELHGTGIIVLPAFDEESEAVIEHEISFQSLQPMDILSGETCSAASLPSAYAFRIDNGNKTHPGQTPSATGSSLTWKLRVPENDETDGLSYALLYQDTNDINGNGADTEYIPLTVSDSGVIYINSHDGTYLEENDPSIPSADDAEELARFRKLYREYTEYSFELPSGLTYAGTDSASTLYISSLESVPEEDEPVPSEDYANFILSVSGSGDILDDAKLGAGNHLTVIFTTTEDQ